MMNDNTSCFRLLYKELQSMLYLGEANMFAASTYDEIVRQEREIDSREIVVFLFVRPTKASDREIINEF